MCLAAQGDTNRQTAEPLYLGIRSAESHRASLHAQLDLHSQAELVRYATRSGLPKLGKGLR